VTVSGLLFQRVTGAPYNSYVNSEQVLLLFIAAETVIEFVRQTLILVTYCIIQCLNITSHS